MRISLSPDTRRRLIGTQQLLLSPLEHDSLDAWRRAVSRGLKALVGADQCMLMMPQGSGDRMFSEEIPRSVVMEYPNREPRLPRARSIWEVQLEQQVWNRPSVYQHLLDEYFRSEYFNDYCVPARAFDSMGFTVSATGEARAESLASMVFHHDRPTGRRFGQRGIELLRLVLPTFQAGVDAYLRLAAHRDALVRSMDLLGQMMLVCDGGGAEFHRTTALQEALAEEPEREVVLARMRAAGRAAAPRAGAIVVVGAASELRTGRARYQIRATAAGGLLGRDAALVSLERLTPAPLTASEVSRRFRLSTQEGRVALMLAEGKRDAEIADALVISWHTARRHVERVLRKLGVNSRAAVAAALRKG